MDGLAIPGTGDAVAFVLPKADRPKFNHDFVVADNLGGTIDVEYMEVFRSGPVVMFGSSGGDVALDGVTFRVGG
jgi:hypothetical protein